MRKNAVSPGIKRRLATCAVAYAVPLAWWFLTPPEGVPSARRDAATKTALRETQNAVKGFEHQFRRLPTSLAEVRAFARSGKHRRYSPYDGYGDRLTFLPLTKKHYFIKSFGADGAANTASSDIDPALLVLPTMPRKPPVYQEPEQGATLLHLYPAALLMGASSPTSEFRARILVDFPTLSRHLIVTHPERPSLIMTASHPGVEEFLWLPNGHEIVYSATGHDRYADGIYLWNIVTGEETNLLANFGKNRRLTTNDHGEHRYLLSLAGLRAATNRVFAYIHPDRDLPIAPEKFYASTALYEIAVPRKKDEQLLIEPYHPAADDEPTALHFFHPTGEDVIGVDRGSTAQKRWTELAISGVLEEVIDEWQGFSLANSQTPIFPYSLWWLGSIYGDAADLFDTRHQPNEALALRAYGAELSKALSQLTAAPTYLRAMAASIHQTLIEHDQLGYQISEIMLHGDGS